MQTTTLTCVGLAFAAGRPLIETNRHVHNMAWGDTDGRTLHLRARDCLYRMRLAPGGGAR